MNLCFLYIVMLGAVCELALFINWTAQFTNRRIAQTFIKRCAIYDNSIFGRPFYKLRKPFINRPYCL